MNTTFPLSGKNFCLHFTKSTLQRETLPGKRENISSYEQKITLFDLSKCFLSNSVLTFDGFHTAKRLRRIIHDLSSTLPAFNISDLIRGRIRGFFFYLCMPSDQISYFLQPDWVQQLVAVVRKC